VSRMPAVYQLLPPAGARPLIDGRGRPLDCDLHDAATWERFGWGPFAPGSKRPAAERAFVEAALARARALYDGLARRPGRACPVPVHALGGDCLLTLARAVAGEGPAGSSPRFAAKSPREQGLLFEAGDGRVTRSSFLADHLAESGDDPEAHGIPELAGAFFGGADHHGLYADPGFQSLLLRLLLRRAPRVLARPA